MGAFVVSQNTFSVQLDKILVNFLAINSLTKFSEHGNNNQESKFAVKASTRPKEMAQLV